LRATTRLREQSHGRGMAPTVFWDDTGRQGTRQGIAARLELDGWLARFIRSQGRRPGRGSAAVAMTTRIAGATSEENMRPLDNGRLMGGPLWAPYHLRAAIWLMQFRIQLVQSLATTALAVVFVLPALAGSAPATSRSLPPTAQCRITDVSLTPGFTQKILDAAPGNRNCWAQTVCQLAGTISSEDLQRLIGLLAEEQYPTTDRSFPLNQMVPNDMRLMAVSCIGTRAKEIAPRARLDLFKLATAISPSAQVTALPWLVTAAEDDFPPAQQALAHVVREFLVGKATSPEAIAGQLNWDRYVYWLRKAADAGLPYAQYELGMYLIDDSRRTGLMHDAEIAEGIRWLERVSESARNYGSSGNRVGTNRVI